MARELGPYIFLMYTVQEMKIQYSIVHFQQAITVVTIVMLELYVHLPSALSLMCVWWMAMLHMKAEWRFVTMQCGELCVTTLGIIMMLWWYAGNLDLLQKVGEHSTTYHCINNNASMHAEADHPVHVAWCHIIPFNHFTCEM